MTIYSNLNIIQKINFKSYCVAKRFERYGLSGFTPLWYPMVVDGILLDLLLHEFEFNRLYDTRIK